MQKVFDGLINTSLSSYSDVLEYVPGTIKLVDLLTQVGRISKCMSPFQIALGRISLIEDH